MLGSAALHGEEHGRMLQWCSQRISTSQLQESHFHPELRFLSVWSFMCGYPLGSPVFSGLSSVLWDLQFTLGSLVPSVFSGFIWVPQFPLSSPGFPWVLKFCSFLWVLQCPLDSPVSSEFSGFPLGSPVSSGFSKLLSEDASMWMEYFHFTIIR